jgi:hypothetical protein
MSIVWTWPLAVHFRDHIPGLPGDNFSFVWNLWWMRKALSAPELGFFHSNYLFSPFGVDLVNHPHTALQGYISATALAGLTVIEAENLYIIISVFLNAVCAYALAFDIARDRRLALLAGFVFGGSPYIAAHLMGHYDLLTAWVIPLHALFLRRALESGRITSALACGACAAIAAYSAYYYVVYIAIFGLAYTIAAWRAFGLAIEPRRQKTRRSTKESKEPALLTIRMLIVGLAALDAVLIFVILTSGGTSFDLGWVQISATTVHNPLLAMWLLALAWLLTKWRVSLRFHRPEAEAFWRGVQALATATATFVVLCLPLIVQAVSLGLSGRYVTQMYFWRSAPRGIDALAPFIGHPFHPLYGGAVDRWYQYLGLNRIEVVGWIGIVPAIVLLTARGKWLDTEEARRWKFVLIVFAIWSLGPFLTIAGLDTGLPLPQALARFIPLVENARMPGRVMVCVYLALGVLMVLRLAAKKGSPDPFIWLVIILIVLDYLHAPIPLTALDRPAVYEQLASIQDNGAVIEVPFGIGDGLTVGRGSQERRLLYHATIHGHPVVGGYIGRMPPMVAQAYEAMPVVGNLLRLSNGEGPVEEEDAPPALPFRYLVLNTATASAELIDYARATIDMDLIATSEGRELYAVQGIKRSNLTAQR